MAWYTLVGYHDPKLLVFGKNSRNTIAAVVSWVFDQMTFFDLLKNWNYPRMNLVSKCIPFFLEKDYVVENKLLILKKKNERIDFDDCYF